MKEEYKDKTKEQLIDEVVELGQRIAELAAADNERKRAEEIKSDLSARIEEREKDYLFRVKDNGIGNLQENRGRTWWCHLG